MLSKIKSISRKKKIVAIFVIIIVAMVSTMALIISYTRMDIVSNIETINPQGTKGKAFIVYRPGISSFQKDMTDAFIEGLSSNGWSIDITTASSQTPTDLSNYDLLVLGTPTYGGKPHQSVLNYIEKVGNLKRKRTAILVTAGSNGNEALNIMESSVNNANGVIVESLILVIIGDNGGDAREISYQAGKSVS